MARLILAFLLGFSSSLCMARHPSTNRVGGTAEVTDLNFSGGSAGSDFIGVWWVMYDTTGASVCMWMDIDNDNVPPSPCVAAYSRILEINTVTSAMNITTTVNTIATAVSTDSAFTGSNSSNHLIITNRLAGAVTDPDTSNCCVNVVSPQGVNGTIVGQHGRGLCQ